MLSLLHVLPYLLLMTLLFDFEVFTYLRGTMRWKERAFHRFTSQMQTTASGTKAWNWALDPDVPNLQW